MAKLKRELGLLEATAYGVGIILGAGVYALIGKAAGIAGPSLWMAFFVGALIASLTGLSYAELGTIFPKEAAEYIYLKEGFNSKRLGFLIGWLILCVGTIAVAAVSLGFGGYLQAMTGVPQVAGAVLLILVMSALNFWGIKESAKMNIVFTGVELLGLLIIIFLGISYFGTVDYFEMPNGFDGIMAASLLIFFAYIGFEDIVNMAEEMRNPIRVIPKALILSVVITTLVYILVSISAVSIMDWQLLGESTAPLADVAETAMPGSSIWMGLIALFATGNTVLILLIVESRMIWGMAKGKSLPRTLGKLNKWRRTQLKAIVLVGLVALFFAVSFDITTIAEICDLGAFIIFGAVNASLIALRYRLPNFTRKFKVPLNIGKFPITAGLGVVFSLYMLTYFSLELMLFGAGVLALGLILYEIMHRLKWIKA